MTVATAPRREVARSEPIKPGRVWPALARREAWSTLRRPLIWVAVAACLYLLWSFDRDQLPHLGGYSTYVGLGLAPLSGAALLVAQLQTSRAQRHGTLEIEEPAPAALRARTLGHLLGSLVVVPLAVVMVTVYMVYLYLLGGTGSPNLGELLIGPLVVGIAVLAGVAAGTWIPNRFGGLIGLGLVAAVQIALQDAPGTRHWFSWWHTVLWYGGFDLWIRPTWAHVAYLVGAAALIGAISVLRHGPRMAPLGTVGLGIVLLVSGGVVQAKPPTDTQANKVWDQITNPSSYWVTVERNGVTYQVFPGYERWIDWWDSTIGAVVAPIPTADRPALLVEQWHHPYPSQLFDEFPGESDPTMQILRDRADTLFDSPITDPRPVRVGETLYLPDRAPLAIGVAIRAVGLPVAPIEVESSTAGPAKTTQSDPIPSDSQSAASSKTAGGATARQASPHPIAVACDAEGQAREVVAAWLAAQASPKLAGIYREIRHHGPAASLDASRALAEYQPDDDRAAVPAVPWNALGWIQYGFYGDRDWAAGVLGSPTATDLAAQMLDLPHEQVEVALRQNWTEWTDPATSVDAIVAAFDLELPPTPAEWILRAGLDPADYTESIAAYPLWLGDTATLGDQPYPTCP